MDSPDSLDAEVSETLSANDVSWKLKLSQVSKSSDSICTTVSSNAKVKGKTERKSVKQ